MKVSDFEAKVWEVEGIRIVIRSAPDTQVGDFDKTNAADAGWRITQLLEKRIYPLTGSHHVAVIQGDGEEPNGNVILRTLRAGY